MTSSLECLSSSTVVAEGRIRNRQEMGLSRNSLREAWRCLWSSGQVEHTPSLFVPFCWAVLVGPVWLVARQVDDLAKALFSSPPPNFHCFLSLLGGWQTWACRREKRGDHSVTALYCTKIDFLPTNSVHQGLTDTRFLGLTPVRKTEYHRVVFILLNVADKNKLLNNLCCSLPYTPTNYGWEWAVVWMGEWLNGPTCEKDLLLSCLCSGASWPPLID